MRVNLKGRMTSNSTSLFSRPFGNFSGHSKIFAVCFFLCGILFAISAISVSLWDKNLNKGKRVFLITFLSTLSLGCIFVSLYLAYIYLLKDSLPSEISRPRTNDRSVNRNDRFEEVIVTLPPENSTNATIVSINIHEGSSDNRPSYDDLPDSNLPTYQQLNPNKSNTSRTKRNKRKATAIRTPRLYLNRPIRTHLFLNIHRNLI